MAIDPTDGASTGPLRTWWTDGVVYQIYPRSFADGDGDGVGDLPGAVRQLHHAAELGVDAVWLSPFYRSPMADAGYDVADHCAVDPSLGTLEDADDLIATAHSLGLRVIVDFVPNHVSSEHPWFVDARSSRSSAHRDWFVWRDPGPGGGPPNNWTAAFAPEPAWTLDEASGQYYLHLFLPEQPDLDWNNPEVEAAMHDVLRFWLDRGVDGFRADVVHCIGKDPGLPDMPAELVGLPAMLQDFGPRTHELLRRMRRVVEERPSPAMVVGETYVLDREVMATYLGRGDELHLAFNFPALHCPWDAGMWREEIALAAGLLDPIGAWPTWVLSNHDVPRHATRYGSQARARAAAVLLLTMRGTPFLYMGEELGLTDAEVRPEQRVDPGGRDGCRAPIPWEPEPPHGWPGTPWLPFPPQPGIRNVRSQSSDPSSMLALYRDLLALRRATPALHAGSLELVDADEGVLAHVRSDPGGEGRVGVAINFTSGTVRSPFGGARTLAGTHPDRPDVAADHLRADEAVVVEL